MLVYESLNYPVIELVPSDSKALLDVGCGNGALGKHLKSRSAKLQVTGITYSEEEATLARMEIDEVIIADLNYLDFNNLKNFDTIVCSHVLEHCYMPDRLLGYLKSAMAKEASLIVALPNVLHWKQRLLFFQGKFRYTDGGLMDKTHFRFFDWQSAQELIRASGFSIIEARAIGNFPMPLVRKIFPKKITNSIDRYMCKLFPGLFGFQFVFSCKLNK